MPAKKKFTSCDWKFTQTLFTDSSTGIYHKILLTLIRVFYDYFRTDNPDLHAVCMAKACAHQLNNLQRFKKTNIFILRLYVVFFSFPPHCAALPPSTSHLPSRQTHGQPLPPTTATLHAAQRLQLQHHNRNTHTAQQLQLQHPTWCNNHDCDTPGSTTSDYDSHTAQ